MIDTLLFALAAVLIVEGLVYALAPSYLEKALGVLAQMSRPARRIMGALMVVVGLILYACCPKRSIPR